MSYRKQRGSRNTFASLGPLFDWAAERHHDELTLAARRLSRRFSLRPATARVVSELAFGAKGAR